MTKTSVYPCLVYNSSSEHTRKGRDPVLSGHPRHGWPLTWDMVTVFEVFFDASTPLCASETCSSLSSSGLGESKISGLEREDWIKPKENALVRITP